MMMQSNKKPYQFFAHHTLSPLLCSFALILALLALYSTQAPAAKASELEIDATLDPIEIDDAFAQADGPTGMEIYAIDLGNENRGDAVLVSSGNELLLMDLGLTGAYDRIAQALNEYGAPKDGESSGKRLSLYFSHYHNDHTGGLGASDTFRRLLSTYEVSVLYVPDQSVYGGKLKGSAYLDRGERLRNYATSSEEDLEVVPLKKGSTFVIGDALALVYGPVGVKGFTDPGPEPSSSSSSEDGPWDEFVNNCSLVTMITCGNTSFLTTGDAKEEAEAALVSTYGSQLEADVFKLAHHGLGGNSEEFLACVRPSYTFGTNNYYTFLRNYAQGNLKVRRTYSAKQKASAYGLCYMLGEEEDGFVVRTDGTSKLCYRHSDPNTPLAGGIVRTVGSFGQDRGGGDYDFYDYYYLNRDGSPITGVRTVTIGGVKGKRLFNDGGQLVYTYKGWRECAPDQLQYIFQNTAILAEGFVQIDGATYYFSPSANYSRVSGYQKIGKNYYLFTVNGKRQANVWYNDTASQDKNHWMYFGANGKRASGLKTIGSDIYYLNPKTGYRAVGPQKVGSNYYCFKDSGRAYTNTTKNFNGYRCAFNKKGIWTNTPSPTTPTITSVTKVGSKKLKVSWSAKTDATGYVVYMATKKNGTYTKVATINSASTTTYVKESLKPKKTYYFKIRSYKTAMGFTFYSKYSDVVSGKTK